VLNTVAPERICKWGTPIRSENGGGVDPAQSAGKFPLVHISAIVSSCQSADNQVTLLPARPAQPPTCAAGAVHSMHSYVDFPRKLIVFSDYSYVC